MNLNENGASWGIETLVPTLRELSLQSLENRQRRAREMAKTQSRSHGGGDFTEAKRNPPIEN